METLNLILRVIKEWLIGYKDCMLFNSVTNMPRWLEVGYGVLVWLGTLLVIATIINAL